MNALLFHPHFVRDSELLKFFEIQPVEESSPAQQTLTSAISEPFASPDPNQNYRADVSSPQQVVDGVAEQMHNTHVSSHSHSQSDAESQVGFLLCPLLDFCTNFDIFGRFFRLLVCCNGGQCNTGGELGQCEKNVLMYVIDCRARNTLSSFVQRSTQDQDMNNLQQRATFILEGRLVSFNV